MSGDLYWRPYSPSPDGERIGDHGIKRLIARRYEDSDGSVNTDWITLGAGAVEWLQGIRDAAGHVSPDAADLLALIEKHGQVEVRVWNG